MFGQPRQGDTAEALEELYRARFRVFLRVAASIAGERHAADVVHNAFVRALLHRQSFRRGGSLEAWVWRIVVNVARDMRGADRNELGLVHDEPASNGYHQRPDERVRAVIAALPPQQRLAVFLRYYADLDYASIGEALGIRPGTVAATLNAAHAALRTQLEGART